MRKWSRSWGGEAEITRLILNVASFELSVSEPDFTSSSAYIRAEIFSRLEDLGVQVPSIWRVAAGSLP